MLSLCLCLVSAVMQAEARAHLEKQLSGNPDGTPVVTLSMLPGCPDQWLLTRCVRGQTPHLVQVEVLFLHPAVQCMSMALVPIRYVAKTVIQGAQHL